MANNVVISRIQNRRGTQADFNALYPTYPGTGPDILQPGEIAICTDTNNIYMGNLNGTYVQLPTLYNPSSISYTPTQDLLQPTSTSTSIPGLTFSLTPFMTIPYSITDAAPIGSLPANATTVGNTFSKNGELQITATVNSVNVVDVGTEINLGNKDINFTASIAANSIIISYTHNFTVPLTLSTSRIIWISI